MKLLITLLLCFAIATFANEQDPSQQFYNQRDCRGGFSYGIEYWHDKCFIVSGPDSYNYHCNKTHYNFDVCRDSNCKEGCRKFTQSLGCYNYQFGSYKFECSKFPSVGPKGFYLTQYHRTCPNDEYVPLLYFSGEHCIRREQFTEVLASVVEKSASSVLAYHENNRVHIKNYNSEDCSGEHTTVSFPILTCVRQGSMFLYFDKPV